MGKSIKSWLLFGVMNSLLILMPSVVFGQDSTPPKVILTDTDENNFIVPTDVITITAHFNEALSGTPEIKITPGISFTPMTFAASNVLLGSRLVGDAGNDGFGESVSLSDDGTVLAIGALNNDEGGNNAGQVKVFKIEGGDWVQIGSNINGENANENSGESISLNSDGTYIAISSPGSNSDTGKVRIYRTDGISWTKVGSDINGVTSGDQFGSSVSISNDGTIVAIGTPFDDDGGTNAGSVSIYQFDGSNWTQMGSNIDGTANSENFGYSVSLTGDGTILAIGAPGNTVNGTNSGQVKVFNWNLTSWTQLGANIDSEHQYDNFGRSVSIENDGKYLAIGAYGYPNGASKGGAYAYVYSGGSWNQLGSVMQGDSNYDFLESVSISNEPLSISVGHQFGAGSKGYLKVYDYDSGLTDWTQSGATIYGESGDNDGRSTSISSNGRVVAVGGYGYDGAITNQGSVRVFSKGRYQYLWDVDGLGSIAEGTFTAQVTATDTGGNAYSGTDSITFTYDITSPTVVLSDTDDDNRLNTSQTVTITAAFSEAMTATPIISIASVGTSTMTPVSGTNSYTYLWDVDGGGTPTDGSYVVTVSGSDLAGNSYSDTTSLTFIIDGTSPTVSLASSDNAFLLGDSSTVTLTATFSEDMQSTPLITIGNGISGAGAICR